MRTSPSGERGGGRRGEGAREGEGGRRREEEGGGGREERGEGGGGGGRKRREERGGGREEEGGGRGEEEGGEGGGGEGGAGEEGDREWSVILPSLIPRSCPPSVMKKKWEGLVYHVGVDCVWTHCMGAGREGREEKCTVSKTMVTLRCLFSLTPPTPP